MSNVAADTWLATYRWLGQYNHWMNRRLIAACEKLPEADRRQQRGAFFGSVHGTLNHVLWGDQMWLGRFAAQAAFVALPVELLSLPADAVHATELYCHWPDLVAQRERVDQAIEDWLAEMQPEFLTSTMRYNNTQGQLREHPTWRALTHFFNHQTHHRGQVTTLLSQAGVDMGVTDLIALV